MRLLLFNISKRQRMARETRVHRFAESEKFIAYRQPGSTFIEDAVYPAVVALILRQSCQVSVSPGHPESAFEVKEYSFYNCCHITSKVSSYFSWIIIQFLKRSQSDSTQTSLIEQKVQLSISVELALNCTSISCVTDWSLLPDFLVANFIYHQSMFKVIRLNNANRFLWSVFDSSTVAE